MDRPAETSLYRPVKAFLERRGYVAKGEVGGCDVVAVRPAPSPADTPAVAVAELKLGFSLELVLQGVDRMAAADEVWLAVRASRRGRDRDRRAWKLCRLLGFGLLAVDPARGAVEVLAEPAPYRPRASAPRRRRLVAEHQARRGDPMPGGSARGPQMTAYRQQALRLAAALAGGPAPVAALSGTVPGAGRILLRDVYGWFERERRGVYRLRPEGRQALLRWPQPAGADGLVQE